MTLLHSSNAENEARSQAKHYVPKEIAQFALGKNRWMDSNTAR
jgi:hypothetical protein